MVLLKPKYSVCFLKQPLLALDWGSMVFLFLWGSGFSESLTVWRMSLCFTVSAYSPALASMTAWVIHAGNVWLFTGSWLCKKFFYYAWNFIVVVTAREFWWYGDAVSIRNKLWFRKCASLQSLSSGLLFWLPQYIAILTFWVLKYAKLPISIPVRLSFPASSHFPLKSLRR